MGGTGAMGGLLAARLAAAGRRVALVGRDAATILKIATDGLTLEDDEAEEVLRPTATIRPEDIGPVDTVFVFVKGPQTGAVALAIGPLVGPETTVATLQNGLGNGDTLATAVDPESLVVGVTYDGATLRGPGHVAHTGRGPAFVGPYLDGASTDRALAVEALLRDAGFDCLATPTVLTEIWRKLIHNAACLPVAALTGLRNAELVAPGPACDVVDALAIEATAVARALGHDIDGAERIERIHTVLGKAGTGIVSMLADVLARRPTEIDTINGAVVRWAEQVGVQVPRHRAMVSLVRGLETSWRGPT